MLADDLTKLQGAIVDARMAIKEGEQLAVAVLSPGSQDFAQKWAREFLQKHAPDKIPVESAAVEPEPNEWRSSGAGELPPTDWTRNRLLAEREVLYHQHILNGEGRGDTATLESRHIDG